MAASISSFYSDLIFKLTHCSKLQNCKCTSFLEWHLFIESNACQKHAWSLESLSVAGQFNIVSLKGKLVGNTFCEHKSSTILTIDFFCCGFEIHLKNVKPPIHWQNSGSRSEIQNIILHTYRVVLFLLSQPVHILEVKNRFDLSGRFLRHRSSAALNLRSTSASLPVG